MRDKQSETLQKNTLVSTVFTDDLGQVSHPFVRYKITLNKHSNIENSFLWKVEKTIFLSTKLHHRRRKTGQLFGDLVHAHIMFIKMLQIKRNL